MAVLFTVLLGACALLIGYYLYDFNKQNITYEHLKIFGALIMFFMLTVILVSFFISNFVVSRINKISETANDIMRTGDLSRRISIDTSYDDLSNLAQTLNALLEQIEMLMTGIRDVSDNIAHDLRTPLARLRNHLEDSRKTPPDTAKINQLIEEADHLLSTFNSILRISNIEKSKRHEPFTIVDIGQILQDVIELYEPLAEEKEIALNTSIKKAPQIKGDKDLLFQVFSNLLDNAIKFSPTGSEITLTLENIGNKPQIMIADQGTGIPPQDIDKVFTRFYRADKSRNTPGTGLGLSLVKAVTDMHKAKIALQDNNPGLIVTVKFL